MTLRNTWTRKYCDCPPRLCLVCGASEPCMTDPAEMSPCTFEPTYAELLAMHREEKSAREWFQKKATDYRVLLDHADADRDTLKADYAALQKRFDYIMQDVCLDELDAEMEEAESE